VRNRFARKHGNEVGMFWLRPDLDRTALGRASWLDTALFDIDGVLIDTSGSYRRSVIAATEYLVRVRAGLKSGPEPLVTPEDVTAFKLAGGFNSDWDLTPALAGIWTARLREWSGGPRAEKPLSAWAADALAATRAGHGGVAWLRATVPASALPDWESARWVHDEYYWGADAMRAIYQREPQYAPDAPGLASAEESLLAEETLPALAALGLTRYGLITGRISPEVEQALHIIAPDGETQATNGPHGVATHPPFAVIVPASLHTKPDPQALVYALEKLEARAAVYLGDTGDDLDLTLRYRAEILPRRPDLPAVLAIAVSDGAAADLFRARGADITLSRVSELPTALSALKAKLMVY
jgi:phosphoglycolate phosphatase-like HAD superfamily hydrolase